MAQAVAGVAIKGISEALIKSLKEYLGDYVIDMLNAESTAISQPHAGAVWISILDGGFGKWNGKVISCYYHPTKEHSATTEGKLGKKKSVAAAGEWAVSTQTRAMWGNKTFYNTVGV